MAKQPSLDAILEEFEREIARAPRFCSVDRSLLQRLIDDHRRLEQRVGILERAGDALSEALVVANRANRMTPTSHSQRESQGRVVVG